MMLSANLAVFPGMILAAASLSKDLRLKLTSLNPVVEV